MLLPQVEAVQPTAPHVASAPPQASARKLKVTSNEAELTALTIRRSVEREQLEVKRLELQRIHDADVQELQVGQAKLALQKSLR